MKKIAITGVMGAGKSSVIAIIKELHYTVLDCDRINDELLQEGQMGYGMLTNVFHQTILDEQNKIDRKKMSDVMFTNKAKKKQVEAILHPLIKQRIANDFLLHQKESIVFVEVPLLYEIMWETMFDEVWVIASDQQLLLARLMNQRGVDKQEAIRRLANQMSQDEKVKKADVVIWNNSNKEILKQRIYDILVGKD